MWYYIEEIIHSIRSLFRKTLVNFKDSALVNYNIKYLSLNESELVYKKKEKEKEETGEFEIVDLKNLDNDNKEDKKADKFKKYCFPVKKFKEQDKTLKSQKKR